MCYTCHKVFIEPDSKIGWIKIVTNINHNLLSHAFCSAPCAIKFLESL